MNKGFWTRSPLGDEHQHLYIPRHADHEVAVRLQQRDYVMMIEPPLQGKTSFLNALCRNPLLENLRFLKLDLTDAQFPRGSSADWYSAITQEMNRQWIALGAPRLPLAQDAPQWFEILTQLPTYGQKINRPITLLCDNVGAPIPDTTGFFGAMRAVYTLRHNQPVYKYLNVLLAGAFEPAELIPLNKLSPFNVANTVSLNNLTFEQVWKLLEAGSHTSESLFNLAQWIFSWTDGQPYLTQWLCSRLGAANSPEDIRILAQSALADDTRYFQPLFAQLKKEPALLEVLHEIDRGEKIEFYPRQIRKQSRLELMGMIQGDEAGNCRFRSRLHEQAFHQIWMTRSTMPALPSDGRIDPQEGVITVRRQDQPIQPHSNLQVRIHWMNRIYPSAYIHHPNAKADIPFLSIEIENLDPTTARTVDVRTVIQEDSHEDSALFTLLPGEKHHRAFLPILTRSALQNLEDLRAASLLIQIEQTEPSRRLIYRETESIHLQARDVALLGFKSPGGTLVDLTHYLAAWVTYRNPDVEACVRKAANRHPQGVMAGYQGAGPEDQQARQVREQMRALYDTLKHDLNLTYVNSLLSLGEKNGYIHQRIRLPQQSLATKSANCVDAAVLFASLIAAVSMRPLLVLLPGHAIVGWYTWEGVTRCEFLDTSCLNRADFDTAWTEGQEQYQKAKSAGDFERELLDPAGFAKTIDVITQHEDGVFPFSS